jgi:hypothetical protein
MESLEFVLLRLATDWERSARQQFACANETEDKTGERVMNHGAMVYFNCASALRTSLDVACSRPSPTQEAQ